MLDLLQVGNLDDIWFWGEDQPLSSCSQDPLRQPRRAARKAGALRSVTVLLVQGLETPPIVVFELLVRFMLSKNGLPQALVDSGHVLHPVVHVFKVLPLQLLLGQRSLLAQIFIAILRFRLTLEERLPALAKEHFLRQFLGRCRAIAH